MNERKNVATTSTPPLPTGRLPKVHYKALSILITICFCVAWAGPVRDLINRRLWPRPDAGVRDAYAFIALAYTPSPATADIGNKASFQMDKHIDALTANGYVPVTLADVVDLLLRGTPLPRKAILLTVEGRNLKLLRHARRAVQRGGWHGVAFFDTDTLAGRAHGTSDWKSVRDLEKSGDWDIGLQGNQAGLTVPSGAGGEQSRFLAGRRWIQRENRLETDTEFENRLYNDYDTARTLAAANLSHLPEAFGYPDGDFGQYARTDALPLRVNLAAASRFETAFTRGSIGRNTMFTDRRRINRLAVDPSWSPSELLDAVKAADREIETVADVDLTRRATGWITDWGQAAMSAGGMELSDAGGSGGARVWLNGSDVRRDFSATLDFRLQRGKAMFYARAERDCSAYLLIEFDSDGNAVLKQKSVLQDPPVMLAETRTGIRPGRLHHLAIFMRDSNINVSVDNLPVFNTHEQTIGMKTTGMIGVAVATEAADKGAAMTFDNVVLQPRRSTLASWDFDDSNNAYVLKWIQSHGSRLTEISPPLAWLQHAAPATRQDEPELIYRQLARIYNLRLTPCIRISSDKELESWSPVSLAGTLNDLDCDGLYVNFEQYDNFQISLLETWLRQTGKMLSGAGRPVLVRLPRVLERLTAVYSLLALIPSVEIVTDANAQVPLTSVQAKQIYEETITPPTPDEISALPPTYTIEEIRSDDPKKTTDMQIRELIDAGESALRQGIYERAIAAFSEWHRLAPASPVPPRRIGDALVSLGYHDEASGFYRQSLNVDPGQIELATRFSKLLLDTGRKTEARSILNTYARLFPDNDDVLLAQAEWLYRENRIDEAAERVDRILRLNPDHFEATLFSLRLADDEVSQTAAIERLMSITHTGEEQLNLVSAIWNNDLLTYQNAHLFIAAMDKIATENKDPRIQELIARMEPLTTTISDDFALRPSLSQDWQVEGADTTIRDGQLTLQAAPSRNEFSVRLLRSERWRDSFIEASLKHIKGGFWLYGRRSRDHLVRFGFDDAGDRLNIQIWKGKNNNVIASRFIPWSFPEEGCTLRLEIRGKAVRGLVNGKAVFDVPLPLPDDFGLGWTAVAAHSGERGAAEATVGHLASGPIPMRIALTAGSPAENDQDRQSENLHRLTSVLTDVSPDWFSIDSSGSWNSVVNEESNFFKLFARYYRLRLTPVVRVSHGAAVTADDIITVCRTHGLDGVILWFETLPGQAWFETMDRELNTPGIDVVAISSSGVSGTETIRGIAASRSLFKAYGSSVPLVITDAVGSESDAALDAAKSHDPVIFRF